LLLQLLHGNNAGAVTNVVFATGFEASEGYDINFDLIGQNGWTGVGGGTIWNGLGAFLPSAGQSAYIGYVPAPDNYLSVWKPLNYFPLASNTPIVNFSVVMQINDSTNNNYDNFYWSVYNTQDDRLFTVAFDNDDLNIKYALDGANNLLTSFGRTFTNGGPYTLQITMNFASNIWSASLNGTPLLTNLPITTVSALLTLGDIDAVWAVRASGFPGDNYMIFDNYQVSAVTGPPSSPQLAVAGRLSNGSTLLRLTGQNGFPFAIDAGTNLVNWTPLKTNVVTGGYFDYVDTGAAGLPRRFYRARWVP
jgi:hypothetical protein